MKIDNQINTNSSVLECRVDLIRCLVFLISLCLLAFIGVLVCILK